MPTGIGSEERGEEGPCLGVAQCPIRPGEPYAGGKCMLEACPRQTPEGHAKFIRELLDTR